MIEKRIVEFADKNKVLFTHIVKAKFVTFVIAELEIPKKAVGTIVSASFFEVENVLSVLLHVGFHVGNHHVD